MSIKNPSNGVAMPNYDKQINDALRLKLGGSMCIAVLNRIE